MDRRVSSGAGFTSRRLPSLPLLVVVASVVCFACTRECRADFKTMAQRLPTESDAIIAINLAKVLETPYAIQNKWGENVADAWDRMGRADSAEAALAALVRPVRMPANQIALRGLVVPYAEARLRRFTRTGG